ncbi:hypothetical protein KUTeg_012291 [Tegillarca granosa]|uniref:VWFA domain-containing protein n=1 Tax=Tegillarca granosa TaxID=220873 RepID=A0ABQ9F1J2_TEGGR|nr:hypothetical protein KUTeg_012291 [Tegillarca granosa]
MNRRGFQITLCWGLPYGGKNIQYDDVGMQTDPHTWFNSLQSDDIMGNGPDDLATGVMRVGAVSFGDKVRLQFGLGVYSNRKDINSSIQKIIPVGGARNTDMALEFFKRRGFAYPEARKNVGQVLIMFVTGPSSNIERTLDQANYLKRQGVYIYVIKIGSDINHTEMIKMASTPSMDYAISESLVSLLRVKVCDDQPAGSTKSSQACVARRPVDPHFCCG